LSQRDGFFPLVCAERHCSRWRYFPCIKTRLLSPYGGNCRKTPQEKRLRGEKIGFTKHGNISHRHLTDRDGGAIVMQRKLDRTKRAERVRVAAARDVADHKTGKGECLLVDEV
jgi:hypothetical protein